MGGDALFIADLHLTAARPAITRIFFRFMEETAPDAAALYVLGDLFEYWIGDDDLPDPFNAEVAAAFRRLGDSGVGTSFLVGNRDFLLAKEFENASGGKILPDPTQLMLFGVQTVITHGDTLCTDDAEYAETYRTVRSPAWQAELLRQPRDTRHALARGYRERSELGKQEKSPEIMDANADAIAALFREYRCPRLIHGHTHRPGRFLHAVDGRECERWVLPAWYEGGGYLRCNAEGCALIALAT